jgi:hypothetical protein
MKNTFLLLALSFVFNLSAHAEANNYYFVVPGAGPKSYMNAIAMELRRFTENVDEGSVSIISPEGRVLCQLAIAQRSVGNYPRLMKGVCSQLKMRLQLSNQQNQSLTASIPITVSRVLNANSFNKSDHLIIFDSLFFNNQREGLDFRNGYPSQGYATKLSYGVSSFSNYQLPSAEGASVHIIYPTEDENLFISKQHETKLLDFYRFWANQIGFKRISIQPITAGLPNFRNQKNVSKNIEPNESSNSVFFTDLKSLPLAAAKNNSLEPYIENLLVNSKGAADLTEGDATLPRYQFNLASPTKLTHLSLVEIDGDYDGSNYIRVDLIGVNGTVIQLKNLIPSGNDEEKKHEIKISTKEAIRSVIVMPMKKDNTPDMLGGWWTMQKLSVTHALM